MTSYLPAIGGAQLHTHQIIRELAARHEISVVTQWDENRTDWLLGTTLRAPKYPKSYSYQSINVDLVTLSQRERVRLLPQILAYYLAKGWAIRSIANALTPKIEPLAAGCDIVHNARIGREGLSFASLRVARKLGVPFVLVPYHHPRWVGWNYRHYIELYRSADAVIALTEWERDTLARLGVHPDRIFVTGTGPVISEQSDGPGFRAAFGLGHFPVILFVGQQYEYKGIDLLLKAGPAIWAREPAARLVFIGPATRYSERLFRGISDGRILNLGKVDLQTKTNALAACDVLCVPSTQESFGGVYTEAWAFGKPVIGGNAPAVREVIQEGENGYVVGPDSGEIAERVNHLLTHPNLRQTMGEAGSVKVRTCYTWNRLAARTEAVYRAVLARG